MRSLSADALAQIARRSGCRWDVVAEWHYDTCDPAAVRTISSSGRDASGVFSPSAFRLVDADMDWNLPQYGESFVLPTVSLAVAATEAGSSGWKWGESGDPFYRKPLFSDRGALVLKARVWLPGSSTYENITLATCGRAEPEFRGDPPVLTLQATHRLAANFDRKIATASHSHELPNYWDLVFGPAYSILDPSYDVATIADLSAELRGWAVGGSGSGIRLQNFYPENTRRADVAFDLLRYAIASPFIDGSGRLSAFPWRSEASPTPDLTWTEDLGCFVAGTYRMRLGLDRVSTCVGYSCNLIVRDVIDTTVSPASGVRVYVAGTGGDVSGNGGDVQVRYGSMRRDFSFDQQWAYADPTQQYYKLMGLFAIGDLSQGFKIPTVLTTEVPFARGLPAEPGDLVSITLPALGLTNHLFRIERLRPSLGKKSFEVTMHDRITFPDLTPS